MHSRRITATCILSLAFIFQFDWPAEEASAAAADEHIFVVVRSHFQYRRFRQPTQSLAEGQCHKPGHNASRQSLVTPTPATFCLSDAPGAMVLFPSASSGSALYIVYFFGVQEAPRSVYV